MIYEVIFRSYYLTWQSESTLGYEIFWQFHAIQMLSRTQKQMLAFLCQALSKIFKWNQLFFSIVSVRSWTLATEVSWPQMPTDCSKLTEGWLSFKQPALRAGDREVKSCRSAATVCRQVITEIKPSPMKH